MVVAKYYTKISIKRLSELLDLPPSEAEKQLSDLVVSKAIEAKVDRPSGIIQFGKRKVCVCGGGGDWGLRAICKRALGSYPLASSIHLTCVTNHLRP